MSTRAWRYCLPWNRPVLPASIVPHHSAMVVTANDGCCVTAAACEVGCESASTFTAMFQRAFRRTLRPEAAEPGA